MKRYDNIFNEIINIENIKYAHLNARKGKNHYTEVKKVNEDIDYHSKKIQNLLKDKKFKNSKYIIFNKQCGKKNREIYKLPYYPDRIIHHAIMQKVKDIWINLFIEDSYACIEGKGIHYGVKRVKTSLKDVKNTKYCLKFDIKKFYPSINNDILKNIIRKKIKDKDLLWLLDEIIDSTKGLPIGNYLSQYLGNLYLTYFDHFCKEKLKIKYYHRYCDDIVIFSSNKEELHYLLKYIKDYLYINLDLNVKENHQIFPVNKRGVNFLGYIFFHTHTLLRKSIKDKMKKKLNKKIDKDKIFASYNGWMKHSDCYNLKYKYFSEYESKF